MRNKLLLLIFAIILCICPLYTTAQVRTFSHAEEKDYGPKALPRVWSSRSYEDGTTVVRIIRRNRPATDAPNGLCFIEMLSLRIIHPNGLVEEKDINLDIQSFNYCVYAENGIQFIEFLSYALIRKNQILVRYHNATDVNDITTYAEWGAIMDFDGNVKSRVLFGPAHISLNRTSGIRGGLKPRSEIFLNINREKGFFRLDTIRNTNDAEWQQYRVEPDGTFVKLTSGILNFPDFSSLTSTVLSTIDEGYAIVYANTTNSYNETNPLLAQGQLFILTIGYNQYPISPLLIYQTPLPNLRFPLITCGIANVGVGQICTLTAVQRDPTGVQPEKTFYVKVNFLSSGSVTSFQVINRILPNIGGSFWTTDNLPFGGYALFYVFMGQDNRTNTYGYLFDESNSETPKEDWGLPNPVLTNTKGVRQILPHNNTLLIAQLETSNIWIFSVVDLPKFVGDKEDKGYSNVNVNSTSPTIGETIKSDLPKISIDFYDEIEPSDGNLTIYQVVDGNNYLRQRIPSERCSVINDKTISAEILGSTFSVSRGSYFIQMDNNFVRSKAYKEPLLGIRENVWTFTTEEKKDTFTTATTGLLRLTSEGTTEYDKLSEEKRKEFFNTLLDELATAVPVSRSRLTTNRRAQSDNTLNEKPYLISVGIKETRDEYDKSVQTIIKDIDLMIKNKDQTPIGLGKATVYLDHLYGFKPSPDLWEKYKIRLLGAFLAVALLIVLFLVAQKRDKNGNNFAILQLGVILFDLVMDVLFVSNNARDLPSLYIPSVVFVTLPIGINTILAFYIITKENSRPRFFQWFMAHGKVASIFTVLAGADIEALNILHSNLAGFPFFRAPFSDDAKTKIFWCACLNIFTEDIPQVVIQIYYKNNTVSYDIIPLLALISSALNLTINIIGRLYQATNRVRNRDKPSNDGSNDADDFGGLTSTPGDTSNISKDIEAGSNEVVSKEATKPDADSPNYLGDILKLNNSEEEKSGLSSVLNKFSTSNDDNNSGNDSNKNQSKGVTGLLKRMVSRKE